MAIPVIQFDNGTASPINLVNLGLTVPASGSVVATGNPGSVRISQVLSDPQLHTFVDAGDITLTVDAVSLTANQSKAYVGYSRDLDNETAAVDPTVNDDADAGYSVGSTWINTTDNSVWKCVDSTNNSAVWVRAVVVFGSPVTISTTNQDGASINSARADHVHAHGDQPGGSLHATATTSVAGFMSAADKTKLDSLVTQTGATQFLSTILSTSLTTFQDAFPAVNLVVPADGTYLIQYEGNILGSSGNTVNEIGIAVDSGGGNVVVADSQRLIQGNGGADLSTYCHTFQTLTAGWTVTGVWRKNTGSGSSTVGNRRITIIRINSNVA